MSKRVISITMILLVVFIITLFYLFNTERKQNHQYEGYLSQQIGNEMSKMSSLFKENADVWREITSTKTMTKDQIAKLNFNYNRVIHNKIEMQQLETYLKVDRDNQNPQYSFYDSILGITEDFLKHIESNRIKNSYSFTVSDEEDIKTIKAIQSLHKEWLPLFEEYENVQDKTVTDYYWVDFWSELDKVTNENMELKDVIG
ncbi:hypothetical protein [Aquibacillus sediminis]|uniref:hypothetical protein n=1 Tax=Aquibacillus sediminis TaxID=2574734 RepID=UPI0011083FFD|nr:hypothetical protein [Aquibacillus sediminis]